MLTNYDKEYTAQKASPSSRTSYENRYSPFSTEFLRETKDKNVIKDFKRLLNDSIKTGYCCCPKKMITISFYDKTTKIQDYYVDTNLDEQYADVTDEYVQIFEPGFQFSYLIKKSDWASFIDKTFEITFNEYYINNLNKARELYDYTIKNNLPIITSSRTCKEWKDFDGEFQFKVADVGQEINNEEIFDNIEKAYPNDYYSIEEISRYQLCETSGGNDCIEKKVFTVYCDKWLHDKFDVYTPKSFFDQAVAEFYVLGSREELDKIDKMVKKERR